MRAVNLLPEQNRRGGVPTLLTTKSVLAGGATLVTAVGLFCGVTFVQSHDKASDRHDTLAGLQQQVDALEVARRPHGGRQQSSDQRPRRGLHDRGKRADEVGQPARRHLARAPGRVVALEPQHAGGHGGAGSGLADAGDRRPPRPRSPPRASRSPRTSSPA